MSHIYSSVLHYFSHPPFPVCISTHLSYAPLHLSFQSQSLTFSSIFLIIYLGLLISYFTSFSTSIPFSYTFNSKLSISFHLISVLILCHINSRSLQIYQVFHNRLLSSKMWSRMSSPRSRMSSPRSRMSSPRSSLHHWLHIRQSKILFLSFFYFLLPFSTA